METRTWTISIHDGYTEQSLVMLVNPERVMTAGKPLSIPIAMERIAKALDAATAGILQPRTGLEKEMLTNLPKPPPFPYPSRKP